MFSIATGSLSEAGTLRIDASVVCRPRYIQSLLALTGFLISPARVLPSHSFTHLPSRDLAYQPSSA